MNLIHALYPYVLAVLNMGIGWLSVAVLEYDLGVFFVGIGLLVFGAVVGRTVMRVAHTTALTTRTAGRRSTRREDTESTH